MRADMRSQKCLYRNRPLLSLPHQAGSRGAVSTSEGVKLNTLLYTITVSLLPCKCRKTWLQIGCLYIYARYKVKCSSIYCSAWCWRERKWPAWFGAGLQCTHRGSQGQSLYTEKLLPALRAFWPLPINPLYSEFYTPTPGSRNKRGWGCWWARRLYSLIGHYHQPMCLGCIVIVTVHFGNESDKIQLQVGDNLKDNFRILQPRPHFSMFLCQRDNKKFWNWSSIHRWRSTQLTYPVQFKLSSALRQCTSTKAAIFVTDRFGLH